MFLELLIHKFERKLEEEENTTQRKTRTRTRNIKKHPGENTRNAQSKDKSKFFKFKNIYYNFELKDSLN